MGANKPAHIKRAGESVLKRYRDKFNDSFEENKKIFNGLVIIESTAVKNRVVGYITTKKKAEKVKS